MVTEFQKTKLKKLFWAYDWDGDEYIELEDFEIAIENLRRASGAPEGSPAIKNLREGFLANWEELKKEADTNGDGKVSLSEWYAHNTRQLESPGGYEFIGKSLVDIIFSLFDKNNDNRFSLAEYKDFCWAYRLRGFSEEENFKKLCPNGDALTREEFLKRVKEFYGDDPNAPGNDLLGPL